MAGQVEDQLTVAARSCGAHNLGSNMKTALHLKAGLPLRALACVLVAAGTAPAWGAAMPAGSNVWMVFGSNTCGTTAGTGLCDTNNQFGAAGGIPMQSHIPGNGSWATGFAQTYPDRTQSYLAGYDAGFIWTSWYDTYTVHGNAAGPFDITVNLGVDGVANSIWFVNKHWLYAGSVTAEIGTFDRSTASPYSEQFRINPFFEGTGAATTATFSTGAGNRGLTSGMPVEVSTSYTKSVLVGDDFELGFGVTVALVVGELDLRHTGVVSFTLPDGVWLTSANGATFGNPTSNSTPEPAGLLLLCSGLMGLAHASNKRRQTGKLSRHRPTTLNVDDSGRKGLAGCACP